MKPGLLISMLVVSGLLTSCNNAPVIDDTSSRLNTIPVGSTFTLNKVITISPDMTSIYLQSGKTGQESEMNIYYPNCKFELFTISESERTVKPDTFTVTRVVNEFEESSLDGMQYAGPTVVADSGPQFYNFMTVMYLSSGKQPDVHRMTCKIWDYIYKESYPSIDQIREAVGDYFSLTIKQ